MSVSAQLLVPLMSVSAQLLVPRAVLYAAPGSTMKLSDACAAAGSRPSASSLVKPMPRATCIARSTNPNSLESSSSASSLRHLALSFPQQSHLRKARGTWRVTAGMKDPSGAATDVRRPTPDAPQGDVEALAQLKKELPKMRRDGRQTKESVRESSLVSGQEGDGKERSTQTRVVSLT